MLILKQGEFCPKNDEKCIVALGNFDGVHIAHSVLLEKTVREAKSRRLIPAVYTFSKHSRQILEGKGPMLITVADEKLELFESSGIERVYISDFENVRNLSPERFVNEILKDGLKAEFAVCGYNFKFGAMGVGNSEMLTELMGGKTFVIPPVLSGNSPVSSTRIREAVEAGDMELAHSLLGRPFFIYLTVVHGKELGRTIGVPTINQNFPALHVVPSHGVYACHVTVDGKKYPGVANVGVRPTVENHAGVNCETHIIGYSGMLYGARIKVSFYKKLRSEMKFDSVDKLREQICADIKSVCEYFDSQER